MAIREFNPSSPMNQSAPSRSTRVWRRFKQIVVIVFVAWNVVFLVYRNIADLWGESIVQWSSDRIDVKRIQPGMDKFGETTRSYASFMGIEQGWGMFASPLARNAPFPALQIEFADDSEELVLSANEPDPEHFLQLGRLAATKIGRYDCKF